MAFATIDVTKGITGTLPTANGGTGATSFSPGKVLQVQEFNYTTYAARTDNSSFSDALHVDITPSASDSKILVTTAGQFSKSGVTEVIYRLFRQTGGSGDSGWSTAATRVGTDVGAWTGSTSQANQVSGNVLWLDSPATTSALRYVFAWTTYDNGVSAQINNYNAGGSHASQIIAMEIAA
jgi:hypothetical protein